MQSGKLKNTTSNWKVFLLGLVVGIFASYILRVASPAMQIKVAQLQLEANKGPCETTRRANPPFTEIEAKLGELSFLGNRDGSWKMFKSILADRSKPPIIYGFGVGKDIS